jgi:BioD-like phosphotransacetylase family protein
MNLQCVCVFTNYIHAKLHMHGSSGSLVIAINDRQVVRYILAALHPACAYSHTNICFLLTNSQHVSAQDGHHKFNVEILK